MVVLTAVVVDNQHIIITDVLLLLSVMRVIRTIWHQRRDVKYHCHNNNNDYYYKYISLIASTL